MICKLCLLLYNPPHLAFWKDITANTQPLLVYYPKRCSELIPLQSNPVMLNLAHEERIQNCDEKTNTTIILPLLEM